MTVSHLSDVTLLRRRYGILGKDVAPKVEEHLTSCDLCQSRQQALEDAWRAFAEWQPADEAHLGWLVHGDGAREAVPRVPGEQADFYREVADALVRPDPQAAMPVDPRDSVGALAVIDAARTSAETGRVVEVVTPGEAP